MPHQNDGTLSIYKILILFFTVFFSVENAFNNNEQYRDHKDTDHRGESHTANNGITHGNTGTGTWACSNSQRNAAKNECKGCHQDRAQTQSGRIKSSFNYRLAIFHVHLRIFYDQDRIFSIQSNQHDQTDLHINVILQTTQILSAEAAKRCHRH